MTYEEREQLSRGWNSCAAFEKPSKAQLLGVPLPSAMLLNRATQSERRFENAQGELSPLEIGIHALGSVTLEAGGKGKTGGLREYARQVGKSPSFISMLKDAATVFETVHPGEQFQDKAKHLYEVSRAPEITWPLLCDALQNGVLNTVDDVSKAVARVKGLEAALPSWWSAPLESFAARAIIEPSASKRLENAFATQVKSDLT